MSKWHVGRSPYKHFNALYLDSLVGRSWGGDSGPVRLTQEPFFCSLVVVVGV